MPTNPSPPLPTTTLSRLRWTALCLLLALALGGCGSTGQGSGVGITGIDHLDEHLSVQNFWVDGYNGAQAGKGGSTVCCAIVPAQWRPGVKLNIRWNVTNWRERSGQSFERDVEIDRYEELGRMFVHFLNDGSVRIALANELPYSPTYPGPRDPIPQKFPWKKYPWPTGKSWIFER